MSQHSHSVNLFLFSSHFLYFAAILEPHPHSPHANFKLCAKKEKLTRLLFKTIRVEHIGVVTNDSGEI